MSPERQSVVVEASCPVCDYDYSVHVTQLIVGAPEYQILPTERA